MIPSADEFTVQAQMYPTARTVMHCPACEWTFSLGETTTVKDVKEKAIGHRFEHLMADGKVGGGREN